MTTNTHVITDQGKYLLSWAVFSTTPTTWEWSWVDNIASATKFSKADAESLMKRSGAAFAIVPAPPPAQPINIVAAQPAPKRMEYRLFEVLDPTAWVDADYTSTVTEAMDVGWKLYGPPFSHQSKVLQAMIREKALI